MRDAEGKIYYICQICRDSGFIHPRKEDGTPDYSKAIPCQCRGKSERKAG
jgi:hypothetical protein